MDLYSWLFSYNGLYVFNIYCKSFGVKYDSLSKIRLGNRAAVERDESSADGEV